jgi:O-antigen/teichoic acid export membrane protein
VRSQTVVPAAARFDSAPRRVLGVTAVAFFCLSAGSALRYGIQVAFARWAGPSNYGAFVFGLTWAQVLAVPAALGMNVAILRYVPAYEVSGDYRRLAAIVRLGPRAAFGAGALIAAFVLLIVGLVRPGALLPSLSALVLMAAMAQISLRRDLIRASGRVVAAYVLSELVPPVAGAFVAVAVYATTAGRPSGQVLLALMAVGFGCAALLQTLFVRRAYAPLVRGVTAVADFRGWFAVSSGAFLVAVFSLLTAQTDVISVGLWLPRADVGVYGAAARTAGVLGLILASVSALVAPQIGRLIAEGRTADTEVALRRGIRLALFPTIACVAALLVAAPFVLRAFGPSFAGGVTPLRILLVAQLANAATGPSAYALMLAGQEAATAGAYAAAWGVTIAGVAVLLPVAGLAGAATAAGLGVVTANALLYRLVRSRLGIDLLRPGRRSPGA